MATTLSFHPLPSQRRCKSLSVSLISLPAPSRLLHPVKSQRPAKRVHLDLSYPRIGLQQRFAERLRTILSNPLPARNNWRYINAAQREDNAAVHRRHDGRAMLSILSTDAREVNSENTHGSAETTSNGSNSSSSNSSSAYFEGKQGSDCRIGDKKGWMVNRSRTASVCRWRTQLEPQLHRASRQGYADSRYVNGIPSFGGEFVCMSVVIHRGTESGEMKSSVSMPLDHQVERDTSSLKLNWKLPIHIYKKPVLSPQIYDCNNKFIRK